MEGREEYKKELEQLMKEMTEEAKKVREDYEKNPSYDSGSVIQIHQDRPFLATREERLINLDGKKIKIKPDSK